MASRGQGCRGRPRGTPPIFYQQAFAEVVVVAAASIAHASAAGGQRGPSDLHRFIAHHPSSLRGGGDPMVADNCFR